MLQQTSATHCTTLHHSVLQVSASPMEEIGDSDANHCNSLQLTATHCNSPQLTATQYKTLQLIATFCNSLHITANHHNTGLGVADGGDT